MQRYAEILTGPLHYSLNCLGYLAFKPDCEYQMPPCWLKATARLNKIKVSPPTNIAADYYYPINHFNILTA